VRTVAIIGAGPGGLVAAKHALDAGLEPVVFEASGQVGGQWAKQPETSGIWPGMTTNTSRQMTAFSDLPPDSSLPLHPEAGAIGAYLEEYAERFGITGLIRFGTRVSEVRPGWTVDGEHFDGVTVANGHFQRPWIAGALGVFKGDPMHACDYPGAAELAGKRVLVLGNGISGSEIAADLAGCADVTQAFRKPRYVIRKNDDGASSDWRWYTHASAVARRGLPREEVSQLMQQRVLRLVGNPADYGAPAPDPSLAVAGVALTQDWLEAVRSGAITCRPSLAGVVGTEVRFADGMVSEFDVVISATGYDMGAVPFLSDDVRALLGRDLRLHLHTLHPDLPGFGLIGRFFALGPYFPLLELQARWIAAVFSGAVDAPDEATMRAGIAAPPRPAEAHDLLALEIAEAMGVAPDLDARPGLTEPLTFGPLLPARWRLDGHGAHPDAVKWFTTQLGSSPRPPVDPEVVEGLERASADP
jgi:dimethylaniline monooxygenase (N-oxide forming)